jgi:hypothetical protein
MSTESQAAKQCISTFNEKPLHSALKRWYARPHDACEVSIDGFIVDIVQGDLIVEIQTRNFAGIKRKLVELCASRPVRLVYPIAVEKWIVKLANDGHSQLGRRKSPKRGALEQLFAELVSFPDLILDPNFSLHVLLIQEEEVRRYDGRRGWRRQGWVTHERRLLQVVDQRLFGNPADLAALIPTVLGEPFTTSELAAAIGKPRRLAQKMAYCLREMGAIDASGKRGNAILYIRALP